MGETDQIDAACQASSNIVSYSPNGRRPGVQSWRTQLADFQSSIQLGWLLFVRNFRARHKQSILGVLWVIIIPLITAAIFTLISRARILTLPNIDIPYTLYALVGLTFWTLFSATTTYCANSIAQVGTLVTKVNFSKISLVLASSFEGLFAFALQVVITTPCFIYFEMAPCCSPFIAVIVGAIPIYLLALGAGCVLALAGAVSRDIANGIGLFLNLLMLASPILYQASNDTFFTRLSEFNPFTYLIGYPRDLLFYGTSPLLTGYLCAVAGSVFACLAGVRFFFLGQNEIAERV